MRPDGRHLHATDTENVSQTETRDCTLRLVAQGRAEPCPREACSFWEPGGVVVSGACLIERLGVDIRRDGLAAYLLETRERLDQVRTVEEVERAHREFATRVGLDL